MGRCMGVLGFQVGGQVRGRRRCCALMGGVRVQGEVLWAPTEGWGDE